MIILPENTTEVHYISQEASSSTNLLQPPSIPLKMQVIMKQFVSQNHETECSSSSSTSFPNTK